MKPLLAVPELLPEDAHAWAVVAFWAEIKHFQLGSRLFASSLYADRRDAELMLTLLHGAPDRGRRRRARAWQGWATAPQGYRVPPR